ncbi:MAG: helix-turn-helix domain-containing protein [Spirochaetaceae bacterium]|nr:helix-turn-helix domain-containing protein [Spirochaetaceae bacterium]
MESIGQKFKDARKEKGLFIEQVARETNISKNYIEAIEEERFDDFPGETYLIGYFRSYASYIGFNPEDIINIYKNTKIQENPVPVELIERKRKFPLLPVAIVAAVLLVSAGGMYFIINKDNYSSEKSVIEKESSVVQNKNSEIRSPAVVQTGSGVEYEMEKTFIERSFAKGDSVIIKYNDNPYRILIKETSDEKVVLELPSGIVELAKGKEILSDIDGDGNNDIRIIAKDIDTAGKGIVLKFDRNTDAPSVVSSGISSEKELSSVSESAVAATTRSAPASVITTAGSTTIQSRKENEVVVFESETMQPFRVNINFKRYCFMRYEADGGAREEKYFHKGDVFRLDVSEQIKIWVSNAQTMSATINNIDYSFGTAGSVSSKIIGWSANPSGGYVVKSAPLY